MLAQATPFKVCRGCSQRLPLSDFSLKASRAAPDRHAAQCHACDSARQARWKAANPEHVRAARRKYREAHLAERRAATSVQSKQHPERRRAALMRYRTKKRAAFVEEVDVAVLYDRDAGRCGICSLPVGANDRSVDHILPISKGGVHAYTNTRLSHMACNARRNNRGEAQLRLLG
jgi:5-methylcytosine-specific restriction endonuclease McrA